MAAIEVHKIVLPRAALNAMPEDERTVLILLGHAANELNVLAKLFHWCAQGPCTTDLEQKARNSQALLVGRLLTAKLFETWELITKSFLATPVGKLYMPDFQADAADALKALKKYFSRTNLIGIIRNSHAFHYSIEETKAAYLALDPTEELELYLSDQNANTLYHFADVICGMALLRDIDSSSIPNAFDKMIKETSHILGLINTTIGECMTIAVTKHLTDADNELPAETITLEGEPIHGAYSVPFFVNPLIDK